MAVDSAWLTYGNREALRDCSIELAQGVTVLLGKNGAGKSTLCRVLAGVEEPDQGTLLRSGHPIVDIDARREHLRLTGWLPQTPDLPGSWTLSTYLEYAAWLKNVSRANRKSRIQECLRAVGLRDRAKDRIRSLSGGMQRRLSLAQALIAEPDFLVLDEPTAGLDPEQRDHFYGLLRTVLQARTVLISTHLLEDLEAFGSRVIVLDKGSERFTGSAQDLQAVAGRGAGSLRRAFLRLVGEESCD